MGKIFFLIEQKANFYISNKIILSAFLGAVFLVFNPFFALFISALISIKFELPKFSFLLISCISFSMFFYLREYDVIWSASSDDVPTYVLLYFSNKGISFVEIFYRFLQSPGNNEPLWHFPFWILLNIFKGSESTFIFIHYFLIFFLLFFSLIFLSNRYFIILIFGYFFLAPVALDSVFHIWRQQIASSIFLLGTISYFVKKNRKGLYLIFLSPLIHLVCLFFVAIFIYFNFLRKKKIIETNTKFIFFVFLISISFVLLFNLGINILASFNLDRVLMYAEDSESDQFRLLIVLSFLIGAMILTHIKYKSDDLNKFLIIITFVVTSMSIAFPNASSIFGRLAYFTVPLTAVYFIRWFLINMPRKYFILFVFFILFSGMYRIVPLITEKRASVQFLAFNHPLDLFMGIIKMCFL